MNILYKINERAAPLAPLSLAMALLIGCSPMPLSAYGGLPWPGSASAPRSAYEEGLAEDAKRSGRAVESVPNRPDLDFGDRTAGQSPKNVPQCANPPNCGYQAPVVAGGTSIMPSNRGTKATDIRSELGARETVSPAVKGSKSILSNQIKKNPRLDQKQANFGR